MRKFKMVIIVQDEEAEGYETLDQIKQIYYDILNDWEFAISTSVESVEEIEIQPQS